MGTGQLNFSAEEVSADDRQYFHYKQPFLLECGYTLPEFTLAFHTFGKYRLNKFLQMACNHQ